MYQAICDASEYLQKEVGHFIPVTEIKKFNGGGRTRLFIPPILAITSVVNDDDTLVEDTDFIAFPADRHWASGPYSWLDIGPDATQLSEWLDEANGVVVTGRWGMYERSTALTATVADTTQQSSSQTTLKVSDGAQVAPGMTLLIGSEQETATGYGDPTTAVTALNGAVTASDEEITVDSAALVNVGEVIRVDFEQMRVRDRNTSNNKLAVWRGWNRTNRVAHLDNASLDVYRTVNVERGVNGTTAAAHANGASISRYDPPDDIRYLTRQIAILMLNKAKGGYAGKSGNTETGTTFYYDAFPRYEVERIAAKYTIFSR